MNRLEDVLLKLKPGIPKRYLLFVAAVAWTFAGGMLFFRGFYMLFQFPRLLLLKTIGCIIAGLIFYFLFFSNISKKHTQRILKMKIEKPCFFSFFNFKSYLIMAIMICMGIILRRTRIVPTEYLSILYLTMGVPLTLSALRFYFNCFNYKKT
jgi:hypothetical protein